MCIFAMWTYRAFTSRFFFTDTATTEIYTLSLHDALPICSGSSHCPATSSHGRTTLGVWRMAAADRKSTRLNSSHVSISYAVFCWKTQNNHDDRRSDYNQKYQHDVHNAPYEFP